MRLKVAVKNNKKIRGATRIIKKLHKAGHEAVFAGGFVRDLIRKVPCEDIDIATSALPDQVEKIFSKTFAVGKQFGVIVVLLDGFQYEVTTFRQEGPYKDGRRPSYVEFVNLKTDVKRRDFTINGLYFDPSKNAILDFVSGKKDIQKKIIRTIGKPENRFKEDKLRLIRAIRFASTLNYKIESRTWAAIKKMAKQIKQVSPERVRDEMIKIFTRNHAHYGLKLLDESGMLRFVLPEIDALKGVKQPKKYHPEGDVFVHTALLLSKLKNPSLVVAFSGLLHDIGKPKTYSKDRQGIHFYGHAEKGAKMAEKVLKRLKFSKRETRDIVTCVANHMKFKDVKQMRPGRLKRYMMTDTFTDELELHKADCVASHGKLGNYRFLKKKMSEIEKDKKRGKCPIAGHDLIQAGIKQGPHFGQLLIEIQEAWLEGQFTNRKSGVTWLKTYLRSDSVIN